MGVMTGGSQWGEASPMSWHPGQHSTRARARMQKWEQEEKHPLCSVPHALEGLNFSCSSSQDTRVLPVLTAQFSCPKDTVWESMMVLWLLRGVNVSLQCP